MGGGLLIQVSQRPQTENHPSNGHGSAGSNPVGAEGKRAFRKHGGLKAAEAEHERGDDASKTLS